MVSSLVSKLYMKVSVSVSIFGSAWYQYQYQYRNFRPAEYQYRIGIEFVDQESISIVSVSEKVVSKSSGPKFLSNSLKFEIYVAFKIGAKYISTIWDSLLLSP